MVDEPIPDVLAGIDPLVWVALQAEAERRHRSLGLVIQSLWQASGSRRVGLDELAERMTRNIVQVGDCLFWTGGVTQSGYGYIRLTQPRRAMAQAHRVAWELTFGPIPDGLMLLHKCDVNYPPGDITYRRCVRPEHLFLGTAADNAADAKAKGRTARGPRNGTQTHPMSHVSGDQHPMRMHPERHARGEAHPSARLTNADVIDIRQAAASGVRTADLARRYRLRGSYITEIVRGVAWAHI